MGVGWENWMLLEFMEVWARRFKWKEGRYSPFLFLWDPRRDAQAPGAGAASGTGLQKQMEFLQDWLQWLAAALDPWCEKQSAWTQWCWPHTAGTPRRELEARKPSA